MNPDLPHLTREEIEVRLTALLLGELPPAEAGAMLQLVANDVALGQLLARLKQTIGLIRAAAIAPSEEAAAPAAPRQIAPERREKLLNHFKLPTPRQLGIPPLPPQRKPFRWLVPALVCLTAVVIMVGLFLPALGSAKMKSQRLPASRVLSLKQDMEERTEDKYATAANVPPAFSGEPATPAVMPPPATPLPVPPPPADSPVLAVATHGAQVAGIVAAPAPAAPPVTDESITSGLRGFGSGGGGFGGGGSATPSSGIAAAGKPGGAPVGNRSGSESWFGKAAEKESLGREAKAKAIVFSTNVIGFADTRLPAGGKPAAPAGTVSGTSTLAVNGGDLYGGVSDKAPALATKNYFSVNGPSGSAGDQFELNKRIDRLGVAGKDAALKPAQAGDERVAGEKVVADPENRSLGLADADAIGVLEAKNDNAFRRRYAYVVPPTKSAEGDLSGRILMFDAEDAKAGGSANQWGFEKQAKEVAESSVNIGADGLGAFGTRSDGAVGFQDRLSGTVRGAEVGGPQAKLALDDTRGGDVAANAIRLPMPTLKGTPAELPAGGKNVESLAETAAKEAAHWVEIQNSSVAAFDTPARPRTVGNLELSLNRKLAKAEPAKDLNFIFKLGEERQFSEEKPASTTSPAKPSSGPVTGQTSDDTAAFHFLADANGAVPANQPANAAGPVPALGDVPLVGRLFRSESQQSAEKAVTTERLEERRNGRDQDTDQAQKKLASLEAQVGQKVEAKAVAEKRRELEELRGKYSGTLQTMRSLDVNKQVSPAGETIMERAKAETAKAPTVWERTKLALGAGEAERSARLITSAPLRISDGSQAGAYTEEMSNYLGTQAQLMKSGAVLARVAEKLKLSPDKAAQLKDKVDVAIEPKTSIFDIRAKGETPGRSREHRQRRRRRICAVQEGNAGLHRRQLAFRHDRGGSEGGARDSASGGGTEAP
jgi:anti-sigma factor RsiW